MDVQEHVDYWLESAKNDLGAAEQLFLSAKYDWCLFIGHLVLEKTLKAYFVYKMITRCRLKHITCLSWLKRPVCRLQKVKSSFWMK
jgi:HEPN domain-containing protein